MKKEVNIVINGSGLSAFGARCVNIVGPSLKLQLIAWHVCPDFVLVSFKNEVIELWFYRGLMIFRDLDDYLAYCVPSLHHGTCRFSSLRGAKAAISRYMNENVVAK